MVRPSTLKAKRFKTDKRPFLEVVDGDGHLVLRVRQATAQGYIECDPNGVFDAAYPESELRRARVKDRRRIAGTLMAGDTQQCVFIEYKE